MPVTFQPGRAAASDVTFSLGGLINLRFDLVSQARSNKAADAGLNMVCTEPHPEGPVKVNQMYVCPSDKDHGPFWPSDLQRGRLGDDGRYVVVDGDEIEAIKTGALGKRVIELSVHDAAEVDAVCRPGSAGYLLRPAKGKAKVPSAPDEKAYATLAGLVRRRPDLALVGSLRLRTTRSVYRVGVWGDQLVLTELVMPSDLKERDVLDVATTDASVAGLEGLLESQKVPFDEGVHRWDVKAAMAELMARKAGGSADKPAVQAPVFAEADIDDLVAKAMELAGAKATVGA